MIQITKKVQIYQVFTIYVHTTQPLFFHQKLPQSFFYPFLCFYPFLLCILAYNTKKLQQNQPVTLHSILTYLRMYQFSSNFTISAKLHNVVVRVHLFVWTLHIWMHIVVCMYLLYTDTHYLIALQYGISVIGWKILKIK